VLRSAGLQEWWATDVQITLNLHEGSPIEVLDFDQKSVRPIGLIPRDAHHDCNADVTDGGLTTRLSWWTVMVGPTAANHVEQAINSLNVIR
jgi:hypothetical protein